MVGFCFCEKEVEEVEEKMMQTEHSQLAAQSQQQQQLVVQNSVGNLSFNSNMAVDSRLTSCSGLPRAPLPVWAGAAS
ncbi:hypothetical protein COP1_022387 [Malus domestica]